MSYAFTNDTITYGDVTTFDSVAALTISYWEKPISQATAWPRVMGRTDGSSTGWGSWKRESNHTSLAWYVGTGYVIKEGVLTEAAWNHIYLVFDGAQSGFSRLRAWVNGSEVSGWAYTGGSVPATIPACTGGTLLAVGSDTLSNSYLAEVAMWIGEAITDSTLISNLAAGKSPEDVTNGRPTGLDFYARLISGSPNDRKGLTATVTGAAGDASHPTVDDPPAGGGGPAWVPRVIVLN